MKNSQYVNRQTAFEYVIYMIVGSYFEESRCKDPVRERGMHFHYRELSEREQLKMEDKCIRYTERFLAELPKGIWKEKVQVRFLKNTGTDDKLVCFVGRSFLLAVGARYDGGNTRLAHRLLFRRRAKKSLRKAA